MAGSIRRPFLALALMLLAAAGGQLLCPSEYTFKVSPLGKLEEQFPKGFGDWREDPSVIPVVPAPSTQLALAEIYSDVVARTYINSKGQRMMLSLAYGEDQRDKHRIHFPRGCYAGQGFAVGEAEPGKVDVQDGALPVMRFTAELNQRLEAVTYWILIDESIATTDWGVKKAQLAYGLSGRIPDGLLVRVSSIGADTAQAYSLQAEFMRDLLKNVAPPLQSRLRKALKS